MDPSRLQGTLDPQSVSHDLQHSCPTGKTAAINVSQLIEYHHYSTAFMNGPGLIEYTTSMAQRSYRSVNV